MKVLFYVDYPLAWARGGHALQINRTARFLSELGVSIEWLRHESDTPQDAEIVHYWGRPPSDIHWKLAAKRGMKLVISSMNPVGSARSRFAWFVRGNVRKLLPAVLGEGLSQQLGIGIYEAADAVITLTHRERDYHVTALGARPEKCFVVPNGVDDIFLSRDIEPRPFDGLLCVGYVSLVKRQAEIARAARAAGIRVRFVGGVQYDGDPYAEEFRKEVDGNRIEWLGEIADRRELASLYKGARGTVLASSYEAQGICLLESVAVGTPVLAPDLPGIRSFFGDAIEYASPADRPGFRRRLEEFHAKCCAGLKQSFKVQTWRSVAEQVLRIYKMCLGTGHDQALSQV